MTSPIRVVFIGHAAELSGAELGIAELVSALSDVDLHVILASDGPLVARLQRSGVSVEVLPLRAVARTVKREALVTRPLRLFAAAAEIGAYGYRLARRLRKLRPDVVHAYTLKSLVYGGLAAKLSATPLVWQVNDRIAIDYLPSPAVRGIRLLARRATAGVIAISETTLEPLGALDVPTSIVHHAIALEPRAVKDQHDALVVGMVGRLAEWKGQHVFLAAFAQAFPDGLERAVVVGSALFGEDDYADALHAQVEGLGISDRVEFRGFRDDIAGELACLDMLVHASVLPEPFGRVVVEGMAAGLPVVAPAAGGPLEIITDGVDGVLYPPGNVAALAVVLQRLASDGALRVRLGEAALRSAERYSPERAAARTLAFYREVLRETAAPRQGAPVSSPSGR